MYLIFTENKNKDTIAKLCTEYLRGCTIVDSLGVWDDDGVLERENGLVIIAYEIEIGPVRELCYAIKKENGQKRVDYVNIKSKVHCV